MNSGRRRSPLAEAGKRLLAALLLCAFSSVAASGAESRPTILRVFAWSDYFADGVLASFEEKFDCVIAIDNFDSNEALLENLLAGDEQYDLVTPSSYMAQVMRDRGMLARLDHARIPNMKNLDPDFLWHTEDPESKYCIPYTRTVTGIGFNLRRLPDAEQTWDIFGRADLGGRMTMLDDMRETIGAALKYLGHSLNTTDPDHLAQAAEQLFKWRENLAMFEVDEGNIALAAGHFFAVHGYNGDVAVVMEENEDIDFFVPREGSAITSDDFAIPAGSANPELAHAFINHLLDIENAAANMESIMYYMPVPAAVEMLSPGLRDNHAFSVPDEVLDKCEVIRNVGEATALYERIWAMVRDDRRSR